MASDHGHSAAIEIHIVIRRTALITGVTGQDGSYLARFLIGQGYAVHGTSRNGDASTSANLIALGIADKVQVHSVNVADYTSIVKVLAAVAPDEIYNLAGQSSVGRSFDQPQEAFNSIALGTINLLEAVRTLGLTPRLFNACSSECFGSTPTPSDETTPFSPQSPYAVAKAAAHSAVRIYRTGYGLRATSGLLFNHESPLRGSPFVTQKIVRTAVKIANGDPVRLTLGNLDIERDWGYAPEYVEAMWMILQADEDNDLVIATGDRYSLREFTAVAFEAVGLDWRDWTDSDPKLFRPFDLQASVGNPKRAFERVGWKATTRFPQLIEKLIDAERRRVAILT